MPPTRGCFPSLSLCRDALPQPLQLVPSPRGEDGSVHVTTRPGHGNERAVGMGGESGFPWGAPLEGARNRAVPGSAAMDRVTRAWNPGPRLEKKEGGRGKEKSQIFCGPRDNVLGGTAGSTRR